MFAGDNGGYAEYLQNAKGDTVKVRAGDGVHFDTAGGDLIAREVLKQLNRLFDLTTWRTTQDVVTTYVALLRAVNVGGKNRLPMAELRATLDAHRLEDVSTVLQSGNVLFRSAETEQAAATTVGDAIEEAFGFRVGVVVRSAGELVGSRRPQSVPRS